MMGTVLARSLFCASREGKVIQCLKTDDLMEHDG